MSYPKHYDLSTPNPKNKYPEPIRVPEAEPRAAHHLDLMAAIESIAKIRNALVDLRSEMEERNEVPDGSSSLISAANPSLLWVLREGPKVIHTQIEDCLTLIQEIRGELF